MRTATLGGLDEARANLEKRLDIKSDKDDASYNEGNKLFKLERYEEAIASYAKPLEIQPNFSEAWYNRGNALFELGRLEDALASYDKALTGKRDFYEAWYNRGDTLFHLGRYEDALASYDQVLEIKQDSYETWNNRGVILWNLGRYEDALASYDQALKIQAYSPEALNNRGMVLDDLGRYEEAIASYDQAIKIRPNFHEAWISKGNVLFELGRYEEAIASFDQALEIRPDLYQVWNNRGFALYNWGHYEEALAIYNKVLELKPDYDKAWYGRGIALGQLTRYEEALASLDKALEFKPDFHQAWHIRGITLAKMGRFEEAITSYNKALIQEESEPEEGESKLLHNVSWEEFENILAAMSDNRSSRVAYDRGTLEIIMPTQTHEYYKEIISFLVQELADEMGKDCEPYGSTTWRRKAKEAGAEPDNSFYIQNESLVRGRLDINLDQDPPPDLVLEIDYTSKSLDRMPIYARLGVPEIWRYDENVLRIYQLESGEYNEIDGSLAFEGFPAQEIPSFIEQNISAGRKALRQRFRGWVRQYLTQTKQVKIDYPTDLVDAAEQTWEQFEQEAKWAMAVKLFEMKRISSGKAAQLVGTDRVTFLLNLHRYGAAMIDLEEEELLSDLENA